MAEIHEHPPMLSEQTGPSQQFENPDAQSGVFFVSLKLVVEVYADEIGPQPADREPSNRRITRVLALMGVQR
ncbi:MAG TPA: hypothetical protein VIS56_00470 [Candidatus Saccharimonadales bacterium]